MINSVNIIEHLGEPEIYAVTAEQANKIEMYDSRWTKNDEMYFIRFPVIYNDIPIANKMYAIKGTDSYFDGSFV